MTGRPHRRVSRLAEPLLVGLLERHFAGTPQQLTVVIVCGLDGFACSRRVFFLARG